MSWTPRNALAGMATLGFVLLAPIAVPMGADLGIAVTEERSVSERDFEAYIEKRAALHMLRAMFDVVESADLPQLIERDVDTTRANGLSLQQLARIDADLVAETSYLLVSLRYLIEVGGAIWPEDRSERAYEADAVAILDGLRPRIIAWLERSEDPLTVLVQLDQIHWWTEGHVVPPEGQGNFSRRDLIVERVLRRYEERSRT